MFTLHFATKETIPVVIIKCFFSKKSVPNAGNFMKIRTFATITDFQVKDVPAIKKKEMVDYLNASSTGQTYNKYKWNLAEKERIVMGLELINKKPDQITKEDLPLLSLAVQTRDTVQCERFLQYRIKNGLPFL